MATVTITITDAPGGVTSVIESTPHVPLLGDGTPDAEKLTPAQAFAISLMMAMAETVPDFDWRTLFVD